MAYYYDENGNLVKKEGKKKKKTQTQTSYSYKNGELVKQVSSNDVSYNDVAPVKKEKERTFFQKSSYFDDGYQFGDVVKTIGATLGDVGENIVKGGANFLERTWDGMLTLGTKMNEGSMMQAANSEMMYNAISGNKEKPSKTLERYTKAQDEAEKSTAEYVAKNIIQEDKIDFGFDEESVLGEKSDDLVQSATDVGLRIGMSAIPGVGAPLSYLSTGLSVMGGEAENAFNNGATFDEAVLSGMISAAAEMGTEALTGGIKLGGKTLTDAATRKIASTISNKTLGTLTKWGLNIVGEGAEEDLSGYLSAIGQKLTYLNEKEFNEIYSSEDHWENFLGGMILGGFFDGVNIAKAKVTGVDYITGLKNNEKAVVDKVYKDAVAEKEKQKGKKLTTVEKTKVFDKVIEQAEKGYISTDTIEEVLGGETYNQYKSASDQRESLVNKKAELQKELEELKGEANTIGNAKRYDLLESEIKDIDAKIKNLDKYPVINKLKEQLGNEVYEQVKDSRLVESYNEKARKGQAFEADLTQYTGKQKEAVERAIKSGVLNNTNRSHELVNILSKIEAEKGIVFDYANNKKLQETGFAIEGKTVNGFANKSTGTVTLNVQSSKAWQSTVGHEITHILEGTDAYTELRSALFEFAKSKGELESRRTALTELYKNIDADIDAELTADLVGDYLFSDTDFINRLTGNRTLFQKIYDEIKYLCKVATGKELTEIEKVREKFDKVWNEFSTEGINEELNDKVTYSVSADSEGNQLSKEQSEYFKDSKIKDKNGNLLVCYHSTPNEFTVFDKEKIGSGNGGANFGKGFYFTPDLYLSGEYGDNTKAYYLNLKNPFEYYSTDKVYIVDMLEKSGYDYDKDYVNSYDFDRLWDMDLLDEFLPKVLKGQDPYTALSQMVQNAGFDGIVAGDEIVAFEPNQIKLTINQNPTDNPDIRYSVSEDIQKTDAAYLKIAESGNTEIAQKMVDDAAKKAGYGIKAYHGTGYDFTVFDKSKQGDNYQDWGRLGKGFYFAPTSREAETWAELSKGAKNKVMPVYLRSENMLDSFEPLPDNLKDTIPENWDSLTRRLAEKYAYNYIEYMQEFGYNVQEILTQKGYDGINGHTEFVVFDPEQVKSADAITYDDKGNVIPLSERFNTANEDIRYSLSEDTQGRELSAEQQVYFKNAKTVDEQGRLKPFYHGTGRADRVGNIFRPDRATSGPMAFFTDNQEIADNYARDKKDTSIAYDSNYDSYETQFRVNRNGKDMSVVELWNTLSMSERNAIKEKAKHITMDEDWENVVYNEEAQYGLGNFDAYELNAHKGNALHTLVDSWLTDGNIYGEEHKFLDVLKLVGIDDAKYMNPDFRDEKTYAVYLNITNPFDTSNISVEMVDAFKKAAENVEFVEGNSADMWDKQNIPPEKWIERLEYDVENGTTHCWTSIPDFVTDVLKAHGYDGIFDTGGKNGGASHTVAIPFYSEQIKNVDNLKPTENPDITLSLSKEGEQFAPIGDYSTPLNETALEQDIAPVKDVAKEATVDDNYAPATAEEVDALNRESYEALTDADAPPVVEQYNDRLPDTTAIDDKALKNIGKTLRDTLSLTAEETKAIQEMVQEYSTSEMPNTDELFDKIKDRFGEKVWKEKNEELADIKRYLKSVQIKVSPKIRAEIADYSDFRKRLGWRVNISNKGIPADVVYKELAEMHPAYFSEDIWNDTDQFLRIAEVAKMETYMQESFPLDDDTIQQAVDIISNEVSAYKENLNRTVAEETAREALDSIAPVRAEQLTDGTRDKALLHQSLDNYPMQTVEQKVAEKIRAVEGELADNKQLRREAEANYNSQIEKLAEEYLAKKDKNTKVANNIIRRISKLERLKASVDADFAKRISDLEARAERMKTPKYGRAMQKQAKMQEHAKWAADLLGDTSTWVDKKIGLQYATNTERRNLRDIVRDENGNVDIARADAIDDALNGQYNREEAAKKRELAKARGKYADLKITKAEDTYIQMLGELRHNPETSLTEKVVNEYYEKHKDKIDTAKVEKVIDLARQDYDSFLNRVNERLREQGMKEIPYRQGYFPHFTEPKQNFIQRLLNWKTQDNEIPTSIAGLTETFKPVKSWQSFDKTRHSDETDYSFTKGFDTYSQGVLDWIYHLDTLQKRRAVENHIRYTHSDEGIQARIKEVYANEELDANEAQAQIEHILAEAKNPLNNFVQDFTTHTNILAGKKNSLDRTVEQATNRHIYSVMTNVQSRLSANIVLANVRSALTNFIPITQSWAQVSPMRSLQATKDTIANAIKDDGMIDKSTFLTNRLREVDNLYQTNWDKVLDKAGIMFEIVDNFSSQVIWRSKYNQNIANGMSESQAIANADQFAENVMAGRSKGNEPTLFNAKNPLVKAFTVFQLEVNNQYGYLFKDVPNDLKAETNHWKLNLAKGYTTAFIGAYIYNALLEQVAGSGAALDPISIIEDLLRDLGLFDDDEEKEPDEVVTNLVDNVVEELPFVGGLFGGGRIPISSALPYSDDGLTGAIEDISEGNWANIGKEMMAPILNIGLPVGGGQIKKTVQGLGMFSDEHPIAGSYTDSGKLRFPVEDTLGNRIQAGIFGQWANENARDYIENGRTPLNEKQTQEFIDVDLPIADYWKYREGLKGLKTTEEKFDYIDSLDLPVSKKNILANNVTDRKEPVDLENYDDYSSLEEFDYATKNPEKYAFAKSVGGYSAYKTYSDELYDIKADKDSSGKSINGSRKEKVVEYINNLDADYETKIILFKSEYPSDDTYNQDIINYLNNREDLTYDERVAIYTELGFRVSDGYVYWD